jgi:hypothetical protein
MKVYYFGEEITPIEDIFLLKQTDEPTTAADIKSTPGKIVWRLMTPFLNKGHILGIDNWYTDIDLVKWLLENGTDVIGTIRKGRKGYP